MKDSTRGKGWADRGPSAMRAMPRAVPCAMPFGMPRACRALAASVLILAAFMSAGGVFAQEMSPGPSVYMYPQSPVPTLAPGPVTDASQAGTGDVLLRHEFWCEIEPHPGSSDPPHLSPDQIALRILEEARFVFSGMTRGFTVVYEPAAPERKKKEYLDVKPRSRIPWGCERLAVTGTRHVESRVLAWVEFRCDERESTLYESWKGSDCKVATGEARVSERAGTAARVRAMELALKNAIRAYAPSVSKNRPRRIVADVAIDGEPRIVIEAGAYQARVRVRIKITEIVPYSAY